MDKLARYKAKNKKQPAAKPKTAKKRKSDGPSCSMFLAEITRKLAARRREEVEPPQNIVQTIVDSITNALPIIVSRKSPPKTISPIQIENLQSLSPELLPNDTICIPHSPLVEDDEIVVHDYVGASPAEKYSFKMPKMPVVTSEVLRVAMEKRRKPVMNDASTATERKADVASEIAKYVGTLRKISLIAEEFNQKTAKNLKEIVDSVQEDLLKKLEEIQAEQKAEALAQAQALKIREEELQVNQTE